MSSPLSPSPQELFGNSSSPIAHDPEFGIEDNLQDRQDVLMRHESDLPSFSSSTSTATSSSSSSSSQENDACHVVTLMGSTANLCSATLGAGILALPFAFYQAGIICGILLLLVSALATYSSIELLSEAYDMHRTSTYEKAVEKGLGRRFRNVVEVSILIFCCGTAVGYVIAVGDIIERVTPFMTKTQKQMAMSSVWLVAMLPLSCLKKMKSLECASSVGIFSMGTLLVAAIVHLVRNIDGDEYNRSDDMIYIYELEEVDDGNVRNETNRHHSDVFSASSLLFPAGRSLLSVLQACPIFFYAFSSQVNVAQIFEELPGRHGHNPEKLRTMSRVTFLGVFVCGILYASLSLVTLIDFRDGIKPNVLSCYNLSEQDQPLLHVAFLGMALAVVIAFPLNIFPARISLIQMWEEKGNHYQEAAIDNEPSMYFSDAEGINQRLLSEDTRIRSVGYNSGGHENDSNEDSLGSPEAVTNPRDDDDDERTEEFRCAEHAMVTLLLSGFALGMALIVPNISVVFGLLGGTTSSLLGFVVPGLLGLEMDRSRFSAWALVIFGCVIGVLSTGATVYQMFHS